MSTDATIPPPPLAGPQQPVLAPPVAVAAPPASPMKFWFYDKQTGAIVGGFSGSQEFLDANMPDGTWVYVTHDEEGVSYKTHRIDVATGLPVELPPAPGPSADQLAAAAREKRAVLLAGTDWTQMADAPAKNKAAWVQYRQALRDVPSQPGFPDTVTWPVAPV